MSEDIKINKWSINGRVLWLYTKYQIVTKSIVTMFLLPSFYFLSTKLIYLSGRTNLTSGNYKEFVFSPYGIILIAVGLLFLILLLGIDINTFIIISSLVKEGKLNINLKEVLFVSIKSVKYFFSPVGVLIALFVAFVLPLLGVGIKMGPFKNFEIPNFITSVIWGSKLYTAIYLTSLVMLFIIVFIYMLTIHFVLIDGENIFKALKKSRLFMKKYWKKFIKDYLLRILKLILACIVLGVVFVSLGFLVDLIFSGVYASENISIIILLLAIVEFMTFIGFIFVPFAIARITEFFYEYHEKEGKILELKLTNKAEILTKEQQLDKIRKKTKLEIIILLSIIFIFNWGVASIMEKHFDEIFRINTNIELIGHRAGGDLEVENSVEGVEAAIREGVSWSEIDVQRTKDGKYILNHDATFKRVSGVNKTPMEMNFDEIKKLKVKNGFNPDKPTRNVASLEEILDTAKGRIGVFVELKEKSADYKMVDDVVKMIEEKDMLNECVILSLDYDMIEYTHENYPQIKTGYLYFFSTGELKDLKGDYLIMEEREATESKIDEIHNAGKKAIVWTVNTPDSMKKFASSNVDGIITDYILELKEEISNSKQRTHLEIIIDSFFSF